MVSVYLCLPDLNLEKVYIDKVKRIIQLPRRKRKKNYSFLKSLGTR